jgi:potassium efflux system protein
VRVGDTVTVGDVSGTVSRLQIRATTITDWDNKEVLVPNKSFITERVVNWTLSNSTTRLIVRIGIAYGSDVAAAHKAITQAVKSVPAVLDNPAPSVFFIGFGESSLDFEVRAFVGQLSSRLPTLHELHVAINHALQEAGIEIPFPQRDLHLRSSDLQDLGTALPVEFPQDRRA